MRLRILSFFILVPGVTSTACGGSGSAASDGGFYSYDAGFSYDSAGRSEGGFATDSGPPPETEENRTFGQPQAGAQYVYVANPQRNNVAVIDSTSLAIETVEAGSAPLYLRTVSGRDQAIVINTASNDATILRTTDTGSSTSSVSIPPASNALAVSPDGQHVVAYFDTTQPNATTSTGSGSFQDIALMTLEPGMDRAVDLSVGFRPLNVQFSSDGASAFVITEDGVSVLHFADLAEPAIVPSFSLGDSPTTRDISVTPDGHYALARSEGSSAITLLDLVGNVIYGLDLGAAVTDLDVSPDGLYALAVIRDQSAVIRIPIPDGITDPTMITQTVLADETFGSVTIAPDGAHAVLYTTALGVERAVILDLTGQSEPTSVRLRKGVRAVAISPDGRTALVVHTHTDGNPNDPNADLETRIDRSFGYSLLDLESGFAKLQLTAADVGDTAVTPDGTYAFLTLRDDTAGVRQVQRISLRSFTVYPIDLGSPPISLGIVPNTHRAFVGQDHPEGRITFIDWDSGSLQSLTGFELNSRIVM